MQIAHVNLQIRPAIFRMIGNSDTKLGCLTGKDFVNAGERNLQTYQVPLTLMHSDKTEACQ